MADEVVKCRDLYVEQFPGVRVDAEDANGCLPALLSRMLPRANRGMLDLVQQRCPQTADQEDGQ